MPKCSVRAGGSLPVYAAPSPNDRGPGSECQFQKAFAEYPEPLGAGPPPAGVTPLASREVTNERSQGACATYYAFRSTASGGAGAVRVIVLDTSAQGEEWGAERNWLTNELAEAAKGGEPAIVAGNADLNAEIAAGQQSAAEAAQAIIAGHASAYLYDSPEEDVEAPLAGSSTPALGSGTLGYVSAVKASEAEFIGASGFLLVHVNLAARASDDVAPVTARLIPNIGELAIEAEQGTLLRRSQVANFNGLARRPRAGGRSQRNLDTNESDLYIPIPENCVGIQCARRIAPEYTFTSSDPEVGNFVTPNTASSEPHAVLLGGAKEEPVPDLESGLFCAYNAGKTKVTISAGGLSSSLTVTVQAGSVRRPCGTVPIKPTSVQTPAPVPPPPAPAPAPTTAPPPAVVPPPVPPPPPPLAAKPAPPTPKVTVLASFAAGQPLAAPALSFVPPPPIPAAQPTPPSGTSAVEAVQTEEDEEEAPESVSNKAVAYDPGEHAPSPAFILGLVVLAAFAGASARRRPRRGPRELRIAPSTVGSRRPETRLFRRRRLP